MQYPHFVIKRGDSMVHVYILQNGLGEYLSFLKEFVNKLICLMLPSVKMESNKKAIPMQEALRSAQINQQAGRLMESYGNSVLRLAYSYLHNMSDAEDVLQDTLIQFLRTQPQFETTEHEKAWFLRVAINISKNKITYNKIRKTDELSETLAVAETEDLAFVWEAVKQLPAKYSEIASLLSKNDATVRSLLQRARMKLKDVLKEVYDFEE